MRKRDWIKVYNAQGTAEAHIIKGLLESNGIPVSLDYEAVGSLLGLTTDGLGEIGILVPIQWEKVARTLLDQEESEKES